MQRPKQSIDCTDSSPLAGLWSPHAHLQHLFYGSSCVQKHLISVLPSPASSRVFVLTGQTLATQTPLIRLLEALLGERHAGTFAGIKEHGQVAGVDHAFAQVSVDPDVDTIVSVGGGSPIDAAKVISFRTNEQRGRFLTHIAIPTTLSAAECTPGGGFTREDGVKEGFMASGMGVSAIFYDPDFVRYTPRRLLLATGMRAIDHAVETAYHPQASLVPWKVSACWALGVMFEVLPQVAAEIDKAGQAINLAAPDPSKLDLDDKLTMLMLAAFASSGLRGANFGGGMGLSHALGHALGSPYGIPHGETSCLTLAPVIRLKASQSERAASQISSFLLPALGERPSGDAVRDAMSFAKQVDELVDQLGLKPQPLSALGIGRDQLPVIVARVVKDPNEHDLRRAVTELVDALF
ncbi:putative Maleylacetate reductase [Podospora didyma]|uniref:Maleylacetate reductase n=1 Tax=Podospora didyma TaxID=330526 RepID=A0AAE0N3B7_9PEZI|nr:putative Maleylacetate reductase [Podospora didyma]